MSRMSYVSSYFHCVFSTKERQPTIPPPLRDRLWPFLGGIARQNGMKAIEIGGETTYQIHVVNQGSKAASNVQIAAILPAQSPQKDLRRRSHSEKAL